MSPRQKEMLGDDNCVAIIAGDYYIEEYAQNWANCRRDVSNSFPVFKLLLLFIYIHNDLSKARIKITENLKKQLSQHLLLLIDRIGFLR